MDGLFKPNKKRVDTRRRRHLFKFIKKVQRISAVVLVWLAVAAVLYGAYTVAFIKPYFKVDKIEVEGEINKLTKQDIIKISGIKMGEHILRVPVGEAQTRLVENPWIKEAAVHRKIPKMIWIYVKEYIPEAIIHIGDWYYIDRYGTPFKKVDISDEGDFPIITGLEDLAADSPAGEFKRKVMDILRLKRLFESSSIGETYGLSEMHYDPNRGFSLITLNDPMELRFGFGTFFDELVKLQTVYPAIRSHGGVVSYVDLSTEGKVVVKYGT